MSSQDFQAFSKKALNKLKLLEDSMIELSHSYWKAKKDFLHADYLYKNGIKDDRITAQIK